MEKYRVHEVAKDFGLPTKEVAEILTKYAAAPKNHMQVLTDGELSVIFDYLTQKNPVSGIQVIYADTYKEEKPAEAPREAPRQEEPKAEAKGAAPQGQKPQSGGQQAPQGQKPQAKPAQSAPQQQAKPAGNPAVPQPASRVPQKKIVDTRKGGDVNLAKYDQRLEELGGQRGDRMAQRGGK